MSRNSEFDDTVRQRSGWLIPIAVFVLTAVLSALFLLFYLAPTPTSFIEEHPSPTSRSEPVYLSVDGHALTIPANYLLYSGARRGGSRAEVELYATIPDFHGYSDRESQVFASNGADSPVIFMLIREDRFNLGEAARLRRVYSNYVADPAGKRGPFDLTEYSFRDDSGYRGEDLFVGQAGQGLVVMRCVRLSQDVPSPSCLRDATLARGISITYRFKRAHLANWRQIAEGVDKLTHSFVASAK